MSLSLVRMPKNEPIPLKVLLRVQPCQLCGVVGGLKLWYPFAKKRMWYNLCLSCSDVASRHTQQSFGELIKAKRVKDETTKG